MSCGHAHQAAVAIYRACIYVCVSPLTPSDSALTCARRFLRIQSTSLSHNLIRELLSAVLKDDIC